MQKDEIIKAPCNECGRSTNHRVIETRENNGFYGLDDCTDENYADEDYGDPDWIERYTMLECCGCESICLQYYYYLRDINPDDEAETFYYPPRIFRKLPKWVNDLPEDMQSLVREVYAAIASDNLRLATMGTRTILDMLMLEKVGDVGTFKEKLNALQNQGFIAQRNREHLAAALDAGSAAAHRGFAPSRDALDQIMDIVENLLHAVYVLPGSADKLKRETPPRQSPAGP